jgi:hypothetical protein
LPKPPSLHWFVVALLSVVTLGIFAWVWFFVQASWIKKIDRHSSARTMFMAALGLALAGGFFAVATRGLGNLLTLASVILVVVATFSMANSVRQLGKRLALPVRFGNLTLFIFQSWYLQGTLTWLARWKETGQAAPEPPKAALWLVMAVPFALAILAAIAIPGFEEARAPPGGGGCRGGRQAEGIGHEVLPALRCLSGRQRGDGATGADRLQGRARPGLQDLEGHA